MQKKVIIVPIIALTCSLIISFLPFTHIFAASPSPSPKASLIPSPTPVDLPAQAGINEVTENIKKRVQAALDDPALKPEPSESPIGYVGVVKDIIKDTVIIEDKDGKKDIKLNDETTIVRSPGTATIKPENIRIDDYIIAIGYPTKDSENILGKRLIVSTDALSVSSKVTGLGTISKIDKNSLTLNMGGNDQVLQITPKTVIKSAVSIIDYSELTTSDTLIYTATKDAKDVQTATILMRIQTAAISE